MSESKYPKIGIRPTIDGRQGGVRESLEEKTMNLAHAVADLISSHLRNGDGSAVECVIADTTIGRVAESAACAEKFEREGVGSTITVTSCWCYGSETMDMNPYYPKAVWGFNGTERPGAVYLAAVLAAHAQKGLPAFGIYGHDVQDLDDNTIPDDVAEKILRFARAAQAVATMRGKSYLSMGNTCMGIAGSIVDADFFQDYLGMRTEYVDLVEILRRVDLGIFDPEEYERAMAWTETWCKTHEGKDYNIAEKQKSREEKDMDWTFTVKNMMIIRDLMEGNPRLRELGFKEEALGHNAILGGVQGQRQWTDYKPNFDFPESLLCTSFDWNGIREARVLATENDSLNGISMLFGHLLTNKGVMFSDIRTYWSPEAVKRVTGKTPEGMAAGGFIHLINSGATTLDATGAMSDGEGKPVMKHHWEMTDDDVKACLEDLLSHRPWLLPRRRIFLQLPHPWGHADDDAAREQGERSRTRAATGRGLDGGPRPRGARHPQQAYRQDLAHHLVCAAPRCHQRRLQGCLFRDEQLGSQPRCHRLRTYRRRPDHPLLHPPHPCLHAQYR